MQKVSKKLIAGVTALGLTLGLAACGSAEGGDKAPNVGGKDVGAMEKYEVGDTFKATEPVKFSLLYRDHPSYAYNKDWLFWKALEENQNVTFDIVSAPLSDWNDRKSLLIGSGDAPSIIPVADPGSEAPYVAGGALLPVSDYLEYLPNFTDKVEKWDLTDQIDALRQEDGKFYILPGLLEAPRPQYSIAVRSDIWDELDLKDPATMDELIASFEVVKEAHPDQYPFSDRWQLNATLNAFAPNFGTSAGWGYRGVTWDEAAEEYVYTGATEGYRDLVFFFAELVEKGLMDPESLSQNDDQAIQKIGSEESLAIGSNDQTLLDYRKTFEDAGNKEADVRLIKVPAGTAGDKMASNGRFESGLLISSSAAKEDNFVAMLQFIDWLYYSDEGLEFAKWGVEGETYSKVDGVRTIAEDIDINGMNPGAPKALNADFGFHNGVFMPGHGSTIDLTQSMLREEVVEFQTAMLEKTELPTPPNWPLTELEREQASLWEGALKDYVDQNTAKFILGQRPLSEWDAYVSELESMSMSSFLDVVNTAQKRFADSK